MHKSYNWQLLEKSWLKILNANLQNIHNKTHKKGPDPPLLMRMIDGLGHQWNKKINELIMIRYPR